METTSLTYENTLPMTVNNLGFLLDRLGQDCHPLQFLRELTHNSIQAIQRTGQAGEIIWDADWNYLDQQGYYKLCITDNGDGMTGSEMAGYINQLSSSIEEQSFSGNYGVGAKIAAATRNHAGLIYLSWKEGDGAMIHLWRDPRTQQYGLKQIETGDSFAHYATMADEAKPGIIKDHGTRIVLLGHTTDADTMEAPEGAKPPSQWVAKYLNSRYFQFPDGITVRARIGWHLPRTNKNSNILRAVTGQKDYLDKHSVEVGMVQLSNATAHWWILRGDESGGQMSGTYESLGHIAALYQDELYELEAQNKGYARLQQFGIIFGYRHIVIYVEPHVTAQRPITTNTARTQLLINNESLPWVEWAAEFRDRIPPEISNYIDKIAAGAASSDHSQTIRERLKHILDLFKISRYKPVSSGTLEIDESSLTRGGQSKQGETKSQGGGGKPGSKGGTAGGLYAAFLKNDGVPGREIRPDGFPIVDWISVEKGTRAPGFIEDRAAHFLREQNRLQINEDFRVFNDMINKWCVEFKDQPGVNSIVKGVVQTWFEQALIETVIGVQQLQDAKCWTVEDVNRALSPEALTSAVMSRYHVNNSVKRELTTRFGKLQS